jgi:hypothetical protein
MGVIAPLMIRLFYNLSQKLALILAWKFEHIFAYYDGHMAATSYAVHMVIKFYYGFCCGKT